MRSVAVGLMVLGTSTLALAQARVDDPLAAARRAYNDRQYEVAIEAASAARRLPAVASSASVVFARAHLELFRSTRDAVGLVAARDALKGVDARKLTPRDHVEFLIGLGESLYLDDEAEFTDRFSAAAELFELALRRAEALDVPNRDLLFEWWALALDRQAQENRPATGHPAYERIVNRAEVEAARPDAPASALYWLAAGALGMNDPQRAWGAAAAGWIRSASLGAPGVALRSDLDRLMVGAVLPDRARQLAPGGDPRKALEDFEQEWAEFKRRWDY